MTIFSPTAMIALKLALAHSVPLRRLRVRSFKVTFVSGFVVKYKTEMCRNWEVFGYCEFNESVSIINHSAIITISIYNTNYCSAPSHMGFGRFRRSSMFRKTIRRSYANNSMKTCFVRMA